MNDIQIRSVEPRVRKAALALFVLGIVELGATTVAFLITVISFLSYALRGRRVPPEDIAQFVIAVGAGIALLLLHSLIILAAYRMRRLRSYGFVTFAAILVMLPITPLVLIGLPIGIWVMAVLWSPEVEAAFNEPNRPERRPLPPEEPPAPPVAEHAPATTPLPPPDGDWHIQQHPG